MQETKRGMQEVETEETMIDAAVVGTVVETAGVIEENEIEIETIKIENHAKKRERKKRSRISTLESKKRRKR
jgi:hypothetical protein